MKTRTVQLGTPRVFLEVGGKGTKLVFYFAVEQQCDKCPEWHAAGLAETREHARALARSLLPQKDVVLTDEEKREVN